MAYPYINLGDISAMVPRPVLIAALDDDKDEAADVAAVNQLLDGASAEVDQKVGDKSPKPFKSPFPAMVFEAARFFAIRAIYTKLDRADGNPFKSRAEDYDKLLAQVAAGALSLDPKAVTSKPAKGKPSGGSNA